MRSPIKVADLRHCHPEAPDQVRGGAFDASAWVFRKKFKRDAFPAGPKVATQDKRLCRRRQVKSLAAPGRSQLWAVNFGQSTVGSQLAAAPGRSQVSAINCRQLTVGNQLAAALGHP